MDQGGTEVVALQITCRSGDALGAYEQEKVTGEILLTQFLDQYMKSTGMCSEH
jgi:hypothetical protein